MKWLAILFPFTAFGQCYQSTNLIRPYGCDYIVEAPPILAGQTVTRCYQLDPQSTNIQPGLVSVQSSGCGPIAYSSLTYTVYDDTCGVLISSGSIWPVPSNPVAFLPDTTVNYLVCFAFTGLCDSINAVCASYVFTTVPVELVSFTGVESGQGIELRWTTGSELGSSHFSVRRSTDLVSWRLVGVVGAAGMSSVPRSYSLVDRSPVKGLNYYRLVQVDLDGSVTNYDVIAVRLESEQVGSWMYWYNLAGQRIR